MFLYDQYYAGLFHFGWPATAILRTSTVMEEVSH
jgi:hypothetical protein